MIFVGIGKKSQVQGETILLVEMTEAEADMIAGVAGKPHISGRYKPGKNVNVTKIYNKVKQINEKHAQIINATNGIKTKADDIKNALPLTEEP